MTNEQYYWYIRRQQLLKAYLANNLQKVQVAGTNSSYVEAKSETELRDAIENAKDGQAVKLTAPMSLTPGSDGIVIKSGKNTVIDLNGQTIDATSIAGESKDAVFAVRRGGTLTSVNAKPVASYAQTGYTRITKFVKGGKFNKELDADLIADGYEQVQDGDWWIVKQI